MAASYAVLTEDERDLGIALVGIGGTATDIICFNDGSIKYTAMMGIGGETVTRDLVRELRVSSDEAERLKTYHGHSYLPHLTNDELITINRGGGYKSNKIKRTQLAQIIQSRMAEMFANAANLMDRAGVLGRLQGGIVLTGGAAMVDGSVELAEEIFRLPVRIGYPRGMEGNLDIARNPEFVTPIGLALYGLSRSDTSGMLKGDDSKVFQKIFGRMREWFEDFF